MRVVVSGLIALVCAISAAAQPFLNTSPAVDAKLASYFDVYTTEETIDARAARAAGAGEKHVVVSRSMEGSFVAHVDPATLPASVNPVLLNGVANSDLVIKGIPLERRSLPNAKRTFLFSEYAVRVLSVLGDATNSVHPGDVIVVARPGGTLMVNNVFVRATEPDAQLFHLDEPYYFLLMVIPAAGAFRALGSGTFHLENGKAVVASRRRAALEPARTESDFVNQLENAIAYTRKRR